MYKKMVLSGGGILACAHIGFLRAISNMISAEAEFYATSAGSIIALMYIVGYTVEEMWGEVTSWDSRILADANLESLAFEYGVNAGGLFRQILESILEKKGFADETLASLQATTKKKLHVTVTNICSNTAELWSAETAPDMLVVDAVYASCCIPFVFCPLQYKGNLYVDGGLTKNLPIPEDCTDTIACHLVSRKAEPVSDFFGYCLNVLACIVTKPVLHGQCDMVRIDCSDVSMFDFDLSTDQRRELEARGYELTREFLLV
jgi:predicted acylesterase/phospholipase RssA